MQLVHFGHSCVLVETGSTRLLLDPGAFSAGFERLGDLTAILITHQHFDHLDPKQVAALVAANPAASLVVDPGSVVETAKLGLTATVATPGDRLRLGDVSVEVVGGAHAVIHPDLPPLPPNVGYLLDHGAFYHPGDSLFVPEQEVDVLGLPIGAPWLKLAEAVDFERAVAPRVAVPIHEAVLSPAGQQIAAQRLRDLAPAGTEFRTLTHGEPVAL